MKKDVRHPRTTGTIILVLILGMWGTIAGPGWNPDPYLNQIVPVTADTTIGSNAITTPPRTYEVEEEIVDIELDDGQTIQATLRTPVGVDHPVPGVIFMHGTGTHMHTAFRQHATTLASAGIATLVGDTPLDSYSVTARNYMDLADAYENQWDWFIEQPGIDAFSVGVYGESEGAFIAPIVAANEPNVGFVILVSGPVLPIRQQGALAADTYLRKLGVPEQILQAIPRLIGGELPGGFDYIDFDVSPYQQQIHQPVLIMYGTGDFSMPVIQGADLIISDLAENGNTNYTLRYYEDADHGLRITNDEGDLVLSTDAGRDLSRWINGLPATANAYPQIAGDQPVQNFTAEKPGSPRWYASGTAAIVILIAGLALTVIGFLGGLIGQIRIKKKPMLALKGIGWPLVTAGLTVVAAWAVLIWYILQVAELALSYQTDAFIVRGGWLLSQSVAILAAGMVIRLLHAWWRARPLKGIAHAVTVTAIIGLATLLAALAYWNVYPSLLTALT